MADETTLSRQTGSHPKRTSPAFRAGPSLGEVSSMLAARIDALVPAILPAARRDGREWAVGSCAGEPGASMKIHRGSARPGVWQDFAAGEGGDALQLVAAVLFGGDLRRAAAWSRSWLGLDTLPPDRLQQARRDVQERAAQTAGQAEEQEERRRRAARAIWFNASGNVLGTPVYEYLRCRGIDLRRMPRLPRAIRYASACRYDAARSFPAMVTAVTDAQGEMIAVHRTYLERAKPFRWGKAGVRDPKRVLGGFRGGFVRLARGKSGRPLKDAPPDDEIVITEGIEDGLTIALARPASRVLCAVSLGNIQNVRLPAQCRDVVLAADNDAPGSAAAGALRRAVDVLTGQGRSVRIVHSPKGKDFNDFWRERLFREATDE